ncbi:rRNA maturation RNase YbeY [Adhaeribacter aquaticus]|uniref:rRNA maturation RNase YbeY n=1 Tax=Adhaeribacter aquaticus TaxID=299567 RepID=UPI0003F954B4|nr:rRNA maturation RNase YbeY [Adhaeribacter aquaticus]
MLDAPIEFVSEDIEFQLTNQENITDWLTQLIEEHDYTLEALTYIFCSDDYLHQINIEYLDHDTYTDIITFNNADETGVIESDIFISIDRIKDNAASLGISFEDELHRVMAHGLLHLLGYDDKTPDKKKLMSEKEDYCLSLRKFL